MAPGAGKTNATVSLTALGGILPPLNDRSVARGILAQFAAAGCRRYSSGEVPTAHLMQRHSVSADCPTERCRLPKLRNCCCQFWYVR